MFAEPPPTGARSTPKRAALVPWTPASGPSRISQPSRRGLALGRTNLLTRRRFGHPGTLTGSIRPRAPVDPAISRSYPRCPPLARTWSRLAPTADPSCARLSPPRRSARPRWGARSGGRRRGRPRRGGDGLPRRLRPRAPAALHRQHRGELGRVDRRLRGPHRRADRAGAGGQRVRRGPSGDRRGEDVPERREQGQARRPDRPPARKGPPPRRRGPRDDPRRGQGPDRGRGEAVRRAGRVHLHLAAPRQAGRAPVGQRPRPRPDRGARPRRAPAGLGNVQDHRRAAPRRHPQAPRPPEPGRPLGRVRLVLRPPGGRLRPDRRPDDRHLRRHPRPAPPALRPAPHLGQAHARRPLQRPGPRRADPGALARQPLGAELARPGRRGRRRRPVRRQDQGVHHRAVREVLRLARLPETALVVLRQVRPLPRRPRAPAGRRTATPRPGTSTCGRTSGA